MKYIAEVTGNTGGPVGPAPTTNNVNIVGDGTTISVDGNPSTNTLTISSLGEAETTYTANTGTATPASGVLNVFGASGVTTTASGNTLIVETTGSVPTAFISNAGTAVPFSNALNVVGTGAITTSATGNTLTIVGSGLISSINIQTFITSGTYTPTSGMLYCEIACIAGGGGGGSAPATTGAQYSCGTGGAAGEYAVGIFTASEIGPSQAVSVGLAGASDSAGGNTSVGALISALGGGGGGSGIASAINAEVFGPIGGSGGTGGSYRVPGAPGNWAICGTNFAAIAGIGANSLLGAGGNASVNTVGHAAVGYGSGGGGAANSTSQPLNLGGEGAPGVVIITEYIG
jgi:hypothetical protein